MTDYSMAGRGLNKVFIGEILCIFAIIPLVGFIIVLVGLILMLVGLYTAGRADAAYQTAFIVTIVNLVLNLFSGLIPLLGIVCAVLGIVQVYLIWSVPPRPDCWRRRGTRSPRPAACLCGSSMWPA